ncbi:MAG: ATP-binding protein [Thermodesulfobacteriota bacterium]
MPAISRVTDGRAGSRDMTRAELAELIANGENSAVEFKEENVHPGVLAEEVVAFANVSGGVILLGVRDDGTVSGVSRPDIEEWVMNICSHNVVPEIIPEFYRVVTDDGRVVVALRIPRGTNRPYRTNQGKYLVRVFLFSDRIEVRSPGRLPNTVTVEKMKVGTSFARNPMLLRYMENLDYVDRLGLGIPMIIERMLQASGREPDLVEKGEEFWLVLYGPCASESASLTPPVEH